MSDDPVTDVLREEGIRRYSTPMPRIETWGDFAEWVLKEGEQIGRFREKLHAARLKEYVRDLELQQLRLTEGAGV